MLPSFIFKVIIFSSLISLQYCQTTTYTAYKDYVIPIDNLRKSKVEQCQLDEIKWRNGQNMTIGERKYFINYDLFSTFRDARQYCSSLDEVSDAGCRSYLATIPSCDDFDTIKESLKKIEYNVKNLPLKIWTSGYSAYEMKSDEDKMVLVQRWLYGNRNLNFDKLSGCISSNQTKNSLELFTINIDSRGGINLGFTTKQEEKGLPLCEVRNHISQTIKMPKVKPTIETKIPTTKSTKTSKVAKNSKEQFDSPNEGKKWIKNIFDNLNKDKSAIEALDNLMNGLEEENREAASGNRTGPPLSSNDIQNVLRLGKSICNIFDNQPGNKKETRNFTKKLIQSFTFILQDENEESWEELSKENKTEAAEIILDMIQYTGLESLCNNEAHDQSNFTYKSSRIEMEGFHFNKSFISSRFIFPSLIKEGGDYLSFPNGVKIANLSFKDDCSNIGSGVIYTALSGKLGSLKNLQPNSKVVSFSLNGKKSETKLPENGQVEIIFSNINMRHRGDRAICMYWDFENSAWKEATLMKQTKTMTYCRANHLTNFAVLMDISGREEDGNNLAKVLTILCSVISILSLIITMFFLSYIKALHNRRNIITINLCSCLLVVHLIVTFALKSATKNETLCQAISGILLFSLCSTFVWMLIEGYFLYQMIILVFSSVGYIKLKWFYFITYGLSTVWVGISIAILGPVGLYDKKHSYFCWISNPAKPNNIWLFAGPAMSIIIANLVVFVISIKTAWSAKGKNRLPSSNGIQTEEKENRPLIKRWIKGWLSLTILLGLTWIIGLLYISEYLSFSSYIFIVINGLQGLFIMLFEIVFNKKARNEVLKEAARRFNSEFIASLTTSSSNVSRNTNSNTAKKSKSSSLKKSTEMKIYPNYEGRNAVKFE